MNGVAVLEMRPGQVQVPAESRADVSAHGFWKRGTTAMFDIRIFNLDSEKALAKAEKIKRTYTLRLTWSVDGLLL